MPRPKRYVHVPRILRTPMYVGQDINAEINARIAAAYRFYKISLPITQVKREQLNFILLERTFRRGFKVLPKPIGGRPKKYRERAKLLAAFDKFQSAGRSKVAMFLKARVKFCRSCGIMTAGGLRDAIRLAKQEREQERLYLFEAGQRALGLKPGPSFAELLAQGAKK
jgi:hypothetical protein